MNTISTNSHNQTPFSKQVAYVLGSTVLILMIPLVAMQLTGEVNWTLSDFVIMGVLLSGIGMTFVVASRFVKTRQNRIVLGAVLLFILLFIWAELAVGIVGSPFAGS